jgi:hypothetical protein
MKKTLIALALALGSAAAVAQPAIAVTKCRGGALVGLYLRALVPVTVEVKIDPETVCKGKADTPDPFAGQQPPGEKKPARKGDVKSV